ncbi:MAG: FAD-binding oxidoreductase [Parvibaculum sp.]
MADLIAKLKDVLGEAGVLTGADATEKAQGGWSHMGVPLAVIRPGSTQDVSKALKICHEAKQGVVAWGGKTGLVDGGNAEGMIALSLERMNKIETVDGLAGYMIAEAGVPLQVVCEAAEAKGYFFPLDLGARGTATIGGNIATNAGGNRVLRFGMMREMVLGLEAVLADGTVISSMNHMLKNNAGYDLKQLFIGTEGTLGIVTRAVLRLRPGPTSQDTAYVAVDRFEALPRLLRHMEAELGGTLSAFEVMWEDFYKLVTRPPAAGKPPLADGHPYYVLIESLGGHQAEDSARFEAALSTMLEEEVIVDAVIAKSQAERDAMWALRDDVAQVAQNWPIFTYDVSLGLADMETYIASVKERLHATWEAPTMMVFGHLGDGNLHVIVGVGDGELSARRKVEEIVYSPLQAVGGSVSAEHGIGLEKRPYLGLSRTREEVALMGLLKSTLDPLGILNPGKVLEPDLKAAAE